MGMFGGGKYNKNSAFLKDEDAGKSNDGGSVASVNSGLFQTIHDVENHAKQIIKVGQTHYVDGIKSNILELVNLWLQEEGNNVFALYGKMGCGKSFFSARLYQYIGQQTEKYDTVAFSSQQLYRDTTNVRNMLLSIAHQLFVAVPACRQHLAVTPLDSQSIAGLTEGVLVAPFENVTLQKPLLIVIDGLDEYPRQDCETFLEALGRLRYRLNPRVKIFFSSRPEAYIMSEMTCESAGCSYHIERNDVQSHSDCACFIDAKCKKADIQIDEEMKRQLIEKSEYSLKYLECFFNDIACGSIRVTADFIENLPIGLSHYYRDQLVRYFGDEELTFYQKKIVPLLELLCVVWRPITIEEASDILGCREADINQSISRSGTLLWKSNRFVMLYQSESIREFLMDDRYCPEKYRIDSERGNARILERLTELMDSGEDIESNMYLFDCAVEHITEKERISNEDWALLVQFIGCYAHKADVMFKLSRRILKRSEREILTFLRHLYSDNHQVDMLLRDAFCVRIIAAACDEKFMEKLLSVLDSLMPGDRYDFLINYGRGRCLRTLERTEEALAAMKPYLEIAENADNRTLFQHVHYLDDVCRIYRQQGMISWEENTRIHVQTIIESEKLNPHYQYQEGPTYIILLRSLAVSYDQLARLCEQLSRQRDVELRKTCAEMLQKVLQLQETDPAKPGYFLLAADLCHKKELRLSKICQQADSYSDSRVYDLHFPFYELGKLYFNKQFPGYNPEKALQYFEDCLSSIKEIAMRPESHERYIRVPIKVYERLTELYMEDGEYEEARRYLCEGTRMRDLRALYHPSVDAEFSCCYAAEQEAELVKAEHGIAAAESHYLAAVQQYQECAQKHSDEFVQRAPGVVYFNMALFFRNAGLLEKDLHYSRLELAELERTYIMYPTINRNWDRAVTNEHIADTLRKLQFETSTFERIEKMEKAIAIYNELLKDYPDVEKYQTACLIPYYRIFFDYCRTKQPEKAKDIMDRCFELCRTVLPGKHNFHSLMDIPLWQALHWDSHYADPQDNILEYCRAYMDEFGALMDEDDHRKANCELTYREAKKCRKAKGIQEAEPLFLHFIEIMQQVVEQWPSEEAWYDLTFGYVDLYQGYRANKDYDKAISYLQEALQVLDNALENYPDALKMRKLRTQLYGSLAAMLQNSSDVQLLSTVVDLYVMQIRHYDSIYQDTKDEAMIELGRTAFTNLQKFIDIQEFAVRGACTYKSCPTELLQEYVRLLINAYTFFVFCNMEGASDRLEHYKDLLAELGGE